MENHESFKLRSDRERAIYLLGCRVALEYAQERPYGVERMLEVVQMEESLLNPD